MSDLPDDRRYSKSHEWIQLQGDVATVGITDYAQKELGEVVYVDLPDVGTVFDSGDELGTIESVKAVSELYMPVAGEISAKNGDLDAGPATVNDDPYGDGWLVKVKVASNADYAELMSASDYEAYLAAEAKH